MSDEKSAGCACGIDHETEACPGCNETGGITWAGGSRIADTWMCNQYGMRWAVTLVNPRPPGADFCSSLADSAEQIGRLRYLLGQIIELAEQAPGKPQDRVLNTTARAVPLPGPGDQTCAGHERVPRAAPSRHSLKHGVFELLEPTGSGTAQFPPRQRVAHRRSFRAGPEVLSRMSGDQFSWGTG